jgi:signal peptidase I
MQNNEVKKEKKEEKPRSKQSIITEMVIYLILILVCIFIIPRYVIQRTVVDGESMENTFISGQSLLVEKVSRHFSDPKRYDVIVFYPHEIGGDEYYVKRVFGLPGETIKITDNDIFINGKKIKDGYGKDPMRNGGIAETEIKLADDEFFVLGDNRLVSLDSRDSTLGPIKRDHLVGKPILRIWPLNKFGTFK